jgi:hypothetical protein
VAPSGPAERIARLPAAKVLERISRARLQRDELDTELALLIDHAVNLGIGWPDISRRLGVSRQAARQCYQPDIATAPAVKIAWPDIIPVKTRCKASAGTRKGGFNRSAQCLGESRGFSMS